MVHTRLMPGIGPGLDTFPLVIKGVTASPKDQATAADRSPKATMSAGHHGRWFGECNMIYADLQDHYHSAEDRFTCNCLGLLRLLPDSDFIDFFSRAMKLDKTHIELSDYEQVSKVDFWPWLPPAGFPDVIAGLRKGGGKPLTLIIEVKHGASKGGAASTALTDEMSENLDSTPSDGPTADQLAKYWQAGCKHFRCPAIIYLTHHRSLPKDDLKESLCIAGADAGIFWLSWFELYRWASDQLNKIKARPNSEAQILKTLHAYLTANEYRCFLGWSLLLKSQACRLDYHHAYDLDRITIPVRSLCFYRTHQEEL
jgi:hypothetical protein